MFLIQGSTYGLNGQHKCDTQDSQNDTVIWNLEQSCLNTFFFSNSKANRICVGRNTEPSVQPHF